MSLAGSHLSGGLVKSPGSVYRRHWYYAQGVGEYITEGLKKISRDLTLSLREAAHSGSGVLAMGREAAVSGSLIYPGQF